MKEEYASLIRKLLILFTDFSVYQGFLSILYISDGPLSIMYRESSLLFSLLFYMIYFVLSEYLFHRTFAMWIFGVSISSIRKNDKNKFLKYLFIVLYNGKFFLVD